MNLDSKFKELYKLGLAYLVCHSIGRMSRQTQKNCLHKPAHLLSQSQSPLCTHVLLLHAPPLDCALLSKPHCWITVAPLISAWQSGSQVLVSLATMGAFFLWVLGHNSGFKSLTSKLPFWSAVRQPLQPQAGYCWGCLSSCYTLDLGGYYLPGNHLNHSCRAWLHSKLRLPFFTLHEMFVQELWPCMYIVT